MEEKIVKSTCRMCHGICQVNVHLKGDTVVKVTGDKESITSRGYICPKGRASVELLYHPDRLTHPLRRVGKKGENKWERISWDEAFDEMAQKLSSIRKEHGPEYVSLVHGTTRPYTDLANRFANAFGTPNYSHIGHVCYVPRVMASMFTTGRAQLPMPDLYGFGQKKPSCIMIWGSNAAGIGAAQGMPGIMIKKAMASADKVIVIDPKKTSAAKKADLWLQIRPGTDGALGLAMIHVIIHEALYDKAFVNNYTLGFNRLKQHVTPFTPNWAKKITRIPKDQIIKAARIYAITQPASLIWGNAIDMRACSFHTARSLLILRGLTGNIDVKGGDIFAVPPEEINLKSQFMNREITGMLHFPFEKQLRVVDSKRDASTDSSVKNWFLKGLLKGVDWLKKQYYPRFVKLSEKGVTAKQFRLISRLKSSKYPLSPMVHQPTLWESIDTGIPYRIKAMWIMGANPLVTLTNTDVVKRALKKLDYLVVSELFMTSTAQQADLVLPAATWLEQNDIVNSFKQWSVLARKKVAQIGETMDDRDVMIHLAKKLNMEHAFAWDNWRDFLDTMLDRSEMNFTDFCDIGSIKGEMVYEKHLDQGFPTPSGRFEFYSSLLEGMGVSSLPIFREPPVSPISTPHIHKKYPLILSAGNKNLYYFHTEGRQLPSLRHKQPNPIVEIHPDTARTLCIEDDKPVRIETQDGTIVMQAKLSHAVATDVVMAPYGWWFPEQNPPDYGYEKASINQLFNKMVCDPDTGSQSLRSTLCKISPV